MSATFVDRFEDLHRVAYRASFAILGDRGDAQDCAQEALARVLVRWNKVQTYAPAWTARVATNLALDRTRKAGRVVVRSDIAVAGGERLSWSDPMADRRRDLVVALRNLPRRQREAVALRYLVDLPEEQAASAMGCSIGTVKSTTAKALQRLRLDLGPRWAWED